MRYSSSAHAARSMVLHRSEQKGRKGFSSQVVSFRQRGHGNFVIFFSVIAQIENPRRCRIPGGWGQHSGQVSMAGFYCEKPVGVNG